MSRFAALRWQTRGYNFTAISKTPRNIPRRDAQPPLIPLRRIALPSAGANIGINPG
jgi:hypothetical protein